MWVIITIIIIIIITIITIIIIIAIICSVIVIMIILKIIIINIIILLCASNSHRVDTMTTCNLWHLHWYRSRAFYEIVKRLWCIFITWWFLENLSIARHHCIDATSVRHVKIIFIALQITNIQVQGKSKSTGIGADSDICCFLSKHLYKSK